MSSSTSSSSIVSGGRNWSTDGVVVGEHGEDPGVDELRAASMPPPRVGELEAHEQALGAAASKRQAGEPALEARAELPDPREEAGLVR